MNDRTRAIEILKQAREVLLSRLAERVLDGQEDILDDAAGFSYCGAIESVHDQLGQRLGNVTALLAHLQSADESASPYDTSHTDLIGTVPEVDAVFGVGVEGYSESNQPARKESSHPSRHEPESGGSSTAAPQEWRIVAAEPSHDSDLRAALAADEPTVLMETVEAPRHASDEYPIEPVGHDQVFQDADFHGVDLMAGDFDNGVLHRADASASDRPAGE